MLPFLTPVFLSCLRRAPVMVPSSRQSHCGLFGTGLGFHETMENRDGVGYAPDLWVNPPDAMEAVARLCRYYGL